LIFSVGKRAPVRGGKKGQGKTVCGEWQDRLKKKKKKRVCPSERPERKKKERLR